MNTISNSELSCFRRCQREHHLTYRLGYVAVKRPDYLRFGTICHRGLEGWWTSKGDRLEAAIAAVQPRYERFKTDEQVDAFELVRAEELMRGYHFRWADQNFVTVGVEVEFVMPIINPATGQASRTAQLSGKVDAIARDEDGRIVVVEHKTTTNATPGTPYWRALRINTQVSTYMAGVRSLGHDPQEALYDVIGKPQIDQRLATPQEKWRITSDPAAKKAVLAKDEKWSDVDQKRKLEWYREYPDQFRLAENQRERDETPEEFRARLREAIASDPDRYYARGVVVRLEEDEQDAAADTWGLVRAMREAELAKRYPRNPDACFRYGSECQFFPVCTRSASLDDPSIYRQKEMKHEELTKPKEDAS